MTRRFAVRRDLRPFCGRRRTSVRRRPRQFEPLEPRCLLSLDGLGPLADGLDDPPPQAALTAADVTDGGGETYQFSIEYTDNVAVDVSDFDDWDVLVAGHGYRQLARFVGVEPNTDADADGTPRTAVYEITAPGGTWDDSDNGTYWLWMRWRQVSDTSENFVPPGLLGKFRVDIEPEPDTTAPEAELVVSSITWDGASGHLLAVRYTDDEAIDVSDLDDQDIRVTGPDLFDEPASFVKVSAPWDGSPRTAVYWLDAPGGSWDSADNGTYRVMVQADQVGDTSDNYVAAGELGTFTVDVPEAPDRIAPEAALSAEDITTGGGQTHTLTVVFTDNMAVDAGDLDDRDIRVAGRWFHQLATFVGSETSDDGSTVTATYEITAPGGVWDDADNGTYSVWMNPWQVSDTSGNYVRGGLLGTFAVDIAPPPDVTPPEATLLVSDITYPGRRHQVLWVKYADDRAIDVSTIDDADIDVVGPDGFTADATLLRVSRDSDGTPRWAMYRIDAPGGEWDNADNGLYAVSLNAGEVADTSGNSALPAELGTFEVDVPEPPDWTRPEATLAAAEDITESGAEWHQFQIDYTDNAAVDVSDLDDYDIRVSGPDFRRLAEFVSVDDDTDGTPRTATYRIAAPGGTWDFDDNGEYTIWMRSWQVSDTNHNFVHSGELGTFAVNIAAPQAPLADAVFADSGAGAALLWYDSSESGDGTGGQSTAPASTEVVDYLYGDH